MNREQASAELAKRMGWQEIERNVQLEGRYVGYPPNKCEPAFLPDYFTDQAAARELVQWIAAQPEAATDRLQDSRPVPRYTFTHYLREVVFKGSEVDYGDYECRLLLATPDEIARAICKALSIKLTVCGRAQKGE